MTDLELIMAIRAAVKGNVAVFYPCECDEHETGHEHFVDQLTNALIAIQRRSGQVPEQCVDDNDWAPLCTYCLQHHPWEDGCTNAGQVPTEEPR